MRNPRFGTNLDVRSAAIVSVGWAAAILAGCVASHTVPVLIGVLSLAPIFAHVRAVGWGRAFREPSLATIVLYFYIFVFPVRALSMVIGSYANVVIAPDQVDAHQLIAVLLCASLGTAVFIQAFHVLARDTESHQVSDVRPLHDRVRSGALGLLAGLFTLGALAAVVVVVGQSGGLQGAQARFLSHTKAFDVVGATSPALGAWAVLSVPAVWASAAFLAERGRSLATLSLAAASAAIIVIQLLVFGSRLNALLALVGVWAVAYYTGRSIKTWWIIAAVPLVVVASVPIVAQRPGGDLRGLPLYERYSRITGYGVLDASLAVRQREASVKSSLLDSKRWLDLPEYLVPGQLWAEKPDIKNRLMDVYVARSIGDPNDANTGFPASYVSELRLYGGILGVVAGSALFGAAFGRLHRALIRRIRDRSTGPGMFVALFWMCYLLDLGLTFYKDGDILGTSIGAVRTVAYLAIALVVTGVWSRGSRRPAAA